MVGEVDSCHCKKILRQVKKKQLKKEEEKPRVNPMKEILFFKDKGIKNPIYNLFKSHKLKKRIVNKFTLVCVRINFLLYNCPVCSAVLNSCDRA